MDVREAIETRRTIFAFTDVPVPHTLLETILSAGIWAPNHHLTEPWSFVIIGEETRHTLAERYAELRVEKKAALDATEEKQTSLRTAAYDKFMAIPTIVGVSCLQEGDEQRKREDYAAACCAIQNIQLAAWAEGIGMQWSTGPVTLESATHELLGLDPLRQQIIGFLYIGYPAEVPKTRRKSLGEVVRRTL